MRVRMGWSGETETNTWQKVDVELEEEDLARLMIENGMPDYAHQRIPVRVGYQLLQNQAELLLLTKLKSLGAPERQFDERRDALARQNDEIITALASRYTVVA